MNNTSKEEMRSFADQVVAALKEQGHDYEVVEVSKNNSVRLYSIREKTDECGVRPSFRVDAVISHCNKVSGQLDVEEACRYILNISSQDIQSDMIRSQLEWDKAKDQVIFSLINSTKNTELLADSPNREYVGDLSIIYKVRIEGLGDGEATTTVSNNLLRSWGVDEETLYEAALKNTPRLLPADLSSMEDVLLGIMEEQAKSISLSTGIPYEEVLDHMKGDMFSSGPQVPLKILSNKSRVKGAASILYPGMIQELAEQFGDFYLIPSSVHEWIIVEDRSTPKDQCPEEYLGSMIPEVNSSCVSAEDYLSDTLYRVREGKLMVA